MAGEAINDQDLLTLHCQDQHVHHAGTASGGKHGWRQYYMATPSDTIVLAYRRWLDLAGVPCVFLVRCRAVIGLGDGDLQLTAFV